MHLRKRSDGIPIGGVYDDWLRTGDLGLQDKAGRMVITGREDDLAGGRGGSGLAGASGSGGRAGAGGAAGSGGTGAGGSAAGGGAGNGTSMLLVPAQGALLGAFVGTGTLASLEAELGRKIAINHNFVGWTDASRPCCRASPQAGASRSSPGKRGRTASARH